LRWWIFNYIYHFLAHFLVGIGVVPSSTTVITIPISDFEDCEESSMSSCVLSKHKRKRKLEISSGYWPALVEASIFLPILSDLVNPHFEKAEDENKEGIDKKLYLSAEALNHIAPRFPWFGLPDHLLDTFDIENSRIEAFVTAVKFFSHHSYTLSDERFLWNRYNQMVIPPPARYLSEIIDLHGKFLAFQDQRRSNYPSDEDRHLDTIFYHKANTWVADYLQTTEGLLQATASADVVKGVNQTVQLVLGHEAPLSTVNVDGNNDDAEQ
jgi:hypothetical protein